MDKKKPPELIPEYVEQVIRMIPRFEGPIEKHATFSTKEGYLPWYSYSRELIDLIHLLHDSNLVYDFNWPDWKDEAHRYHENPCLVKSADLAIIRKLITTHTRADRFCDGHLAEMIHEGHFIDILNRLQELNPVCVNDIDILIECKELLNPRGVCSAERVLEKPCPVPKSSGLYAWFFKEIPPEVPVDKCRESDDLTLLYIGISPKSPPKKAGGKPQTLRTRIRNHYKGNAEGSTLRLSLGCLLSEELGIKLQRVGNGKRLTFGRGEHILSNWMHYNAFVNWIEHPQPWTLEERLIKNVSLPLNLSHNEEHPFYPTLKEIRRQARARARALPMNGSNLEPSE